MSDSQILRYGKWLDGIDQNDSVKIKIKELKCKKRVGLGLVHAPRGHSACVGASVGEAPRHTARACVINLSLSE